MGSKKNEMKFLYGLLIIAIGLLPVIMKRQPKIDWIIAYLMNAISNVALDKLITKNFITYPTRLLPKLFNIHILYDVVLYPTVTVIYNQMTSKDNLLAILFKLILITAPLTIFEFWAARHTGLIKWKNGWRWYHTFLSVTLKSLWTRIMVGIIRRWRESDDINQTKHKYKITIRVR